MTLKSRWLVMLLLSPPWAVFILACYWYFFDNATPAIHTSVRIMNQRGDTITDIKRGERMVLARESCVTDEGKAFYTRTLAHRQQKLVYFMPSSEVQLTRGCFKRFNSIEIPSFIEPGTYDYIVAVTFENNPLVSTRMILPIPTFEVLP